MSEFQKLIHSGKPVLVDFYATWCGPCKTMTPILKEVAGKVEGKAHVIKIDIDKSPRAATAFNVQAVPTLLIFKNGKVMWRQAGLVTGQQLEITLLSFL